MSVPTLGGAALRLDRAVTDAVGAATAQDGARLLDALARLEAADPEHVRRLLAAVVRPVLEDLHPDGVDGDDLADLIESVERDLGWFTPPGGVTVDRLGLAVVLTGAFGIVVATRDELPRRVTDPEVTLHAVLLLGHLLTGGRRLRPYLDRAWAEIAREDAQD